VKYKQPFSLGEYQARLKKTQQSMLAAGIDVLIVSEPSNLYYLTGYDAWSFYTPQYALISQNGDKPLLVVRGQDINGAKLTSYLADDRIVGYSDHYIQNPAAHCMEYVARQLRDLGQGGANIGYEGDSHFFSARSLSQIQAQLPNARFVDADALVNWVRSVKSDAEIGYMRQAARLTDLTMERAINKIRPGVRLADVAAEVYATSVAGLEDYAGEYSAMAPLIPAGVGTSCPHVMWRDERYQKGSCTTLEFSGVKARYHAPQSRTVFLGKPDPKAYDCVQVVLEGIEAVLDIAKEGVYAHEVHAAWDKVITKHGIVKDSRCGYSIGIGYPPDWGERTISFRPIDNTLLTENVTMHFMPGVWFDDWGVAITESIRITKEGAECLCTTPRELFIID
jgi:ectoine hydrolase